jgi:ABC-type dipeptide/oligopeptide/nickel transport system permease subunit
MIVLALMIILVSLGPVILRLITGITADYIPADGNQIKSFPPSLQHWMGTDEQGRDIFARVLQGGRISLAVGLISTIVSLAVGVSYGAIAGYLGGKIDNVMMRMVDIIYAIPYILIVIVLLWFWRTKYRGLTELYPRSSPLDRRCRQDLSRSISFALWRMSKLRSDNLRFLRTTFGVPVALMVEFGARVRTNIGASIAGTFRLAQSRHESIFLFSSDCVYLTMVASRQILSLKNRIRTRAKATGVSTFGIIFAFMPNALDGDRVRQRRSSAMLSKAFLSYLGLGVQAYASWGSLAADGVKNRNFPWQLIFPGVTWL